MSSSIFSGVLIESAALTSSSGGCTSGACYRSLTLASAASLTRMLITGRFGTGGLTLSLKVLALCLPTTFATGFNISATATLFRLTGALAVANLMLGRLLRYAVRQFSFRITRAFAFGFLRDVAPNLLLLLLVFDPIPTVIDFIGPG